jgi:hypothetical protein
MTVTLTLDPEIEAKLFSPLTPLRRYSKFMSYVTIEAEIENGRILPKDNFKLPRRACALVTLLAEGREPADHPSLKVIESVFGAWKDPDFDSVSWQRQIRDEWER